MAAAPVISAVLGSCIGCQASTEQIVRMVPNSLNLMTLTNFCFVTLEGLFFQNKFFSVKQHIPSIEYLKMVFIYFIVNVCNNYAIKFNVYFPLLIVFKSSSLFTHLVLRYTLLGQTYNVKQVGSILIATAGVIIFTLASYEPSNSVSLQTTPAWAEDLFIPPFVIGITLLSIAVLFSSYLGIRQEQLYARYGPYHKEAMFFVHFFSLPTFALFGNELVEAARFATASEPLVLMETQFPIPSAWFYILGGCLMNWICVHNVYRLTAVTSSLNVNMVISLRKFVSLFISFVLFNNAFNVFHFFGAFIVFIGTLIYTLVF